MRTHVSTKYIFPLFQIISKKKITLIKKTKTKEFGV